MNTRFLIIFAFVMLLFPLNLANGLPLHESCIYNDPRINLFPSKDEFALGEQITIIVDTLHDDVLKIVAQDSKNLVVFSDVISSDSSGKATINIPTSNESDMGTWKIFVKSQSTESQEVVFVGVGQSVEPTITFNPDIPNHAYGKGEPASFFVVGMPNQSLNVHVYDSDGNNMLKDRVVLIPSEGRCNYSLDISEFDVGVYNVNISDKQEDASITFTVGLKPSTAPVSDLEKTTKKPVSCHFGDSDTPDSEIFAQDMAVKTFVEKYSDSNRTNTIHSSEPFDATLTYKTETVNEKISLIIEYWQNENGCYRPKNYQYSYDDGAIDVTIRNMLSNFTEIINLINSDNKTLLDFYPDDCSFVDLDYSLSDGIVYGICKAIDHPTITIQAKAYSDSTFAVNIPIEMVYSLSSSDCVPSNDFFVFTASGEKPYDITPTDIGNLVTVELDEGSNRISIAGSWIIPDPSPSQYCGIVEGYGKKYLPPRAQIDHDMRPTAIKCNDGLVLIQKYDDSPACVTPETQEKLIERQWTKR